MMDDTKTLIIRERRQIYEKGIYHFSISAERLKELEVNSYKVLKVRLRENSDNVMDPEIAYELVAEGPPKKGN